METMILVFSEYNDWNTKKVLEYFEVSQQKYVLFSELDLIEGKYDFSIAETKVRLFKNDEYVCDLSDVQSVWYRRVDIQVKPLRFNQFVDQEEKEYATYYDMMRKEFLSFLLQQKRSVGVFDKGNFNKLEFIFACKKLGINFPKTIVTSDKPDLMQFLIENNSKVVSKTLSHSYAYPVIKIIDKEIWKRGSTVAITEENIELIPSKFELSMFQEKLDKELEIRVFYFKGECYSQAILSQQSKNGKLDYRLALNDNLDLRQCYYKLPKKIEKQVDVLMKHLKLDIGALDIVYTTNREYVFLEVNPSGQYGDASENTNKNFEYKIAQYLMSK